MLAIEGPCHETFFTGEFIHALDRHVREALLEDAYNGAVDVGDFDETAGWVRGTRTRRRSHD